MRRRRGLLLLVLLQTHSRDDNDGYFRDYHVDHA
jgi:hypothetical protein